MRKSSEKDHFPKFDSASGVRISKGLRLLSFLLLAAAFSGVCFGQSYALMLQQSPADGVMITPSAGIHQTELGQTMPLRAVPMPGYRFLHWLGDVSDSTTNQTTVNVDSPKLIVAVFERIEQEVVTAATTDGEAPVAGASAGRLTRSNTSVSSGSRSGFSTPAPRPSSSPSPSPEHTPEPATCLLLSCGALMVLRSRKSAQ